MPAVLLFILLFLSVLFLSLHLCLSFSRLTVLLFGDFDDENESAQFLSIDRR